MRTRVWLAALIAATTLVACATKMGKHITTEIVETASSVQSIYVMPDRGYVVDSAAPPSGPHKSIRVEFVRPVVRASLDPAGFSLVGYSTSGTPPPPVAITAIHFDDNPSDADLSGAPAISLTLELNDGDIQAGAGYSLSVDQPAIVFASDAAAKSLSFVLPLFRALPRPPSAPWPVVVDLKPGPSPRVPGWGVPVGKADLTSLADAEQYATPSFSYMAPHAELLAEFSETMLQFAAVSNPLDPAIQWMPKALSDPVGFAHPAPFSILRSRTATGLIPDQAYAVTFLSRDTAGLIPFTSGTQDWRGRFLGINAAPDLAAVLDVTTDRPMDAEFRFASSHVRIEQPKMFADHPIGLSGLVNGALPLEVLTTSSAAEMKTSATGAASVGPYPIKKVPPITTVEPATLSQAGLTKDLTKVATAQPVAAAFDGTLTLSAEVFDSNGRSLGQDTIDFDIDLVPPVISASAETARDDNFNDGKLDRLCLTASEDLSSIVITVNGSSVEIPASSATQVDTLPDGKIRYCFQRVSLPGGAGANGQPYQLSLVGKDKAGNESQVVLFDIACRVPKTTVREFPGRQGHLAYVDSNDIVHVITARYEGDIDTYYLSEHVQGVAEYASWTDTTIYLIPHGQTHAGMFDLATGPDGSVHICLPIRNAATGHETENVDLIYLARKSSTSAWHSQILIKDTGPFSCSIAYDAKASPSDAQILIAYPRYDTNLGMLQPYVARIRRLDDPGLPCFPSGTPDPACDPKIEPVDTAGCLSNGCGNNISMAVAPDGTEFAAFQINASYPRLVLAKRDAASGQWKSALVKVDNPDVDDINGVYTKRPLVFVRAGEVQVFTMMATAVPTYPSDPAPLWRLHAPIGTAVGSDQTGVDPILRSDGLIG